MSIFNYIVFLPNKHFLYTEDNSKIEILARTLLKLFSGISDHYLPQGANEDKILTQEPKWSKTNF